VLLVIAPSAHPDRDSINRTKRLSSPHLGLAYIAATLVENGYTVAIVDLLMDGTTIDTIRGLLQERGPRLVGITATTEAYNNAVRIARVCKKFAGVRLSWAAPRRSRRSDSHRVCRYLVVRDEGEFRCWRSPDVSCEATAHLQPSGLSYRTASGQVV
jgi:hypothetical protein